MVLPGRLFVIEGPDGVGKTTLVRHLHEQLKQSAIDCVSAAFPGSEHGSIGHFVHRLHHDPGQVGIAAPAQAALQFLHVAAHVDALERVILPALRAGRVVILDRSWWSTFVYGRESGVDEEAIVALLQGEMHFWQGVVPNAVFLITRSDARFEHPSYSGLSERYRELASREEDRYPVHLINNDGNIASALRAILEIIATSVRIIVISNTSLHDEQLPLWEDVGMPAEVLCSTVPQADPPTKPSTFTGPDIIVRHHSTRPSKVFDTYWTFAAARQDIFFRRFAGEPPPWTSDPTLQEHKFTNVYRACDRVSQFLIRNVIREGDASPDEVFFRIILFKFFNRIDTWHYLESSLGPLQWRNYSFERYNAVLSRAMAEGRQIYSAAYIMPSARAFGHERKHSNHLRLLELMMKDDLPSRLRDAASLYNAFLLIRNYHSIGDFLAYQYVTDLNYSNIIDFDEDDFVVAGPGARDGIRKCFQDTAGLTDDDIIKTMADSQDANFSRLGISFQTLWGRPLKYIDCQNLFCEVGKYARAVHPDIMGLSGRTRIKQRFTPSPTPIQYEFPEKWEINQHIAHVTRSAVIGRGQLSLILNPVSMNARDG